MLITMETGARQQALRAASDALLALRRLERKSTSDNRAACGVTASQGILVHEVVMAGESGSTASELAARLGTSVSAVTQIIDGLADAGILERSGDAQDRRRTRILLTAHGRTLYSFFDGARLAQAESLFHSLDDDEVHILANLLSKATHERQ